MENTLERSAASEDIRQILSNMHETDVLQLQMMKKQLKMARLTAIIVVVALIVSGVYLAIISLRFNQTFTDLAYISAQLAEVDLPTMIADINKLVKTSQDSLEIATRQIESIDIASLNKSIQDLSRILEPLARLFGR
jgi:hypothetical protein